MPDIVELTRSLESILTELTSEEVYVELSTASTPSSFIKRLLSHPLVDELTRAVLADAERVRELSEYLQQSSAHIQGAIRDSHDIALCASVVALSACSDPSVDAVLTNLVNTRVLALKWPSLVAAWVVTRQDQTTTALTSLSSKLWSKSIEFVPSPEEATQDSDNRASLIVIAGAY